MDADFAAARAGVLDIAAFLDRVDRGEGEAEERALSYNDLQKIAPLDMLRHTFAARYGGELPEEIETLFNEVMREVSL